MERSATESRLVTLEATPGAVRVDIARAAALVVDMQNDFGARTNHEASLLLIETLFGWVSDSARLIRALKTA